MNSSRSTMRTRPAGSIGFENLILPFAASKLAPLVAIP